jgi:Calcium binding
MHDRRSRTTERSPPGDSDQDPRPAPVGTAAVKDTLCRAFKLSKMSRSPRDEEREQRIAMEIVVDAYGPEEQAMGWYYSLEDRLRFPFTARCVAERVISPLRVGDEVEIVGMAPESECGHEMFVLIRWERGTLGVPLSQLVGVAVDEGTHQAIEDWRYWVAQGYEL